MKRTPQEAREVGYRRASRRLRELSRLLDVLMPRHVNTPKKYRRHLSTRSIRRHYRSVASAHDSQIDLTMELEYRYTGFTPSPVNIKELLN